MKVPKYIETLLILAWFALAGRIVLLGSERLFLKKLEYDSISVAAWFFLTAAISLLPIFLYVKDVTLETWYEGRYALISSLLYSLGFYLYVKAISLEDTALIAPLYNSSLLWVMILGLLFLGEPVTYFRVIGAILIFGGIFYLYEGSVRKKINAMLSSKGSILMIIGSVFLAVGRTIDTISVRTVDPSFYAFLINLYVGIYLLVASFAFKRASVIFDILKKDKKWLAASGISNGWSYLLLLVALTVLDLTIAQPLSLLSVFVTALLGKYFLNEEIKKRLSGIFVIVIGAAIIILSRKG